MNNSKTQKARTKNVNLLSFDDDGVEDDQVEVDSKIRVSSHDVLHDPRLKKETAVNKEELIAKRIQKEEIENKKKEFKQRVQQPNINQTIEKNEEVQVKKRKLNDEVNIEDIIQEEDRYLLNYAVKRNEKGNAVIDWDQKSESSSSSSSSLEEYQTEQQRLERQKQKEQYENLKAEVLSFKTNQTGTYNEKMIESKDHEIKLLSNLEKQRLRFITNKKQIIHDSEIQKKLDQFKEKLHSKEINQNKNHWMNNNLKFHVDSLNAFSVQEVKSKVEDFFADEIQKNKAPDIKFKSDLSQLFKLSE